MMAKATEETLLDGLDLGNDRGIGLLGLVDAFVALALGMQALEFIGTDLSWRRRWWRRNGEDELVLMIQDPPVEFNVPIEDSLAIGGNPITGRPVLEPVLGKSRRDVMTVTRIVDDVLFGNVLHNFT